MIPSDLFRQLPSVDALLQEELLAPLLHRHGRPLVVQACREVLAEVREEIRATAALPSDLLQRIEARAERLGAPTLRAVINATGVLLHTNLGRAPLSERAIAAMAESASSYSNLEYDLAAGQRGSRYVHVGQRLAAVSGAEAGLVVNNNAAALVLVLAAFAAGKEVVVSRAHLVEIGGGFRIPDIMEQSGAILREVGTTNRTYARDFAAASGQQSALYLRVHPSNFRIEGFTHQPTLEELAALAHERGLLLVDDLGSGALLDTSRYGMTREPQVQESVRAGAALTLFSGDKLLGGPQAGCIVGRETLIAQLRAHPLARALRVDKLTLAGLDATLRAYQEGRAVEEIPIWQMIATTEEQLHATAQGWASRLREVGMDATVRAGHSAIGGGALPGDTLPTWLVAIRVAHPDSWSAALRGNRPPIITRIEEGQIVVDPRTVQPAQEAALLQALRGTRAE